jgi:hypothetical protein
MLPYLCLTLFQTNHAYPVDAQNERKITMTNQEKLRWYPLTKIAFVARELGWRIPKSIRDNDGEYGLNLPSEVVRAIERIDWRRV